MLSFGRAFTLKRRRSKSTDGSSPATQEQKSASAGGFITLTPKIWRRRTMPTSILSSVPDESLHHSGPTQLGSADFIEVDGEINKRFSDRRLDILTSSLGPSKFKDKANNNTASATQLTEKYSEADLVSRSPSISPQFEIEDPLTQHWQQSPKRGSFIIRRLTRNNNRRSISVIPPSPSDPDPSKEEEDDMVWVPQQFQEGVEMLRVTRKKVTKRVCWIDPTSACVGWDSKSSSKRTVILYVATNCSLY